jgi:hypothetical protein
LISSLTLAALLVGSAAADLPSQWDFNAGNLATSFGPGTLNYWDLDPNFPGSASATSFGTCSSYGIGLIGGSDAAVMHISAYTAEQGLLARHGTPSNGGGTYGNQYTLIFDIYVSHDDFLSGSGWLPFHNTNCCNTNDADAYIQFDGAGVGSIGTLGEYHGTFNTNTWHRVAWAFDLGTTASLSKYIDGVLVGTQTGLPLDGTHSIYTTTDGDPDAEDQFHLFTEGDTSGQYTTAAYLNSIFFTDRTLAGAEIAALGGADADGIGPIGPQCSCPGDIAPAGAPNGIVDINDLSSLLSSYGLVPADPCVNITGPGGTPVDINDLAALLGVYGTACP